MYKSMPVRFVFPTPANEYEFVSAGFGPNRPFHKKLSLGTEIPSQLKAINLQTFVEDRRSYKKRLPDLDLCR
jgi:hypothetical protein